MVTFGRNEVIIGQDHIPIQEGAFKASERPRATPIFNFYLNEFKKTFIQSKVNPLFQNHALTAYYAGEIRDNVPRHAIDLADSFTNSQTIDIANFIQTYLMSRDKMEYYTYVQKSDNNIPERYDFNGAIEKNNFIKGLTDQIAKRITKLSGEEQEEASLTRLYLIEDILTSLGMKALDTRSIQRLIEQGELLRNA